MSQNLISQFGKFNSIQKIKAELYPDGPVPGRVTISPLYGSAKALFVENLSAGEKQMVVLFGDVQSVLEFTVELDLLGLAERLLAITEFKADMLQEKLTDIAGRQKLIIVTTYDFLNCLVPSKSEIESNTTKITVGGDLTYNDLIEYFNLLNYQREKFVESPGEYSQRGSIIDFWSYSEKNAVRLEFDGDFLESIRRFDPESQRSIEKIESVTIAGFLGSTEDETKEPEKTLNYF